MNVANILLALDTVSALMARATAWNMAVRDANQENRDLTDAEVKRLRDADDQADTTLKAAIEAKAKREG